MIELLKKYDRPAPRYTSYPTAPHFRHEIDSQSYASILANVDADQAVSLYVHIPFCRHLCTYCGCNTKIVDHEAPIVEYMGTLRKEVELVAKSIGRQQRVSHIHFGGGTPNYAPVAELKKLMDTFAKYFVLEDDLVIAMECDPRLLTQEQVKALTLMGVNRISFGVQEFNLDVQDAINRIQPFAMVKECTKWFREEGIKSINFDMIYGLPLQTRETMQKSMQQLAEISPDRVALFGYAHVPWFKEHQKKLESFRMPDTLERYQIAEDSRTFLIENGYTAIGIDHFAKPEDELAICLKEKTLHRNFQGYTSDKEQVLIGFGQSSISDYGSSYVQNTLRNKEYRERVTSGEFPVVKACLLSADDIQRRAVIEQIMCYYIVDVRSVVKDEAAADVIWNEALPLLRGFKEDGLVEVGEGVVTVTEQGRIFTRLIAGAFDAYLQASSVPRRHAKAV